MDEAEPSELYDTQRPYSRFKFDKDTWDGDLAWNQFGMHLIEKCVRPALKNVEELKGVEPHVRQLVHDAVRECAFNFVDLLGNFDFANIDEKHHVVYELKALIKSHNEEAHGDELYPPTISEVPLIEAEDNGQPSSYFHDWWMHEFEGEGA